MVFQIEKVKPKNMNWKKYAFFVLGVYASVVLIKSVLNLFPTNSVTTAILGPFNNGINSGN